MGSWENPEVSVPFVGGGTVGLRSGTIALLKLLTQDQVKIGDFAISTDVGLVRCYAVTSTGSSWEADASETLHWGGESVSATLRYVAFSPSVVEGTNMNAPTTNYHPGAAFRCEQIRAATFGDPNSTILGIHKSGNTTPEDTDTQDPGAANVWWTWECSEEFADSDYMSISFDHAGSTLTYVQGTATVRRIFPE